MIMALTLTQSQSNTYIYCLKWWNRGIRGRFFTELRRYSNVTKWDLVDDHDTEKNNAHTHEYKLYNTQLHKH